MALFNAEQVMSRANSYLNKSFGRLQESVSIESAMKNFSEKSERVQNFDIFLSHSYSDRKGAIGLQNILENDFGYSVYIDWVIDRNLDRNNVSSLTAKTIKERMKKCRCLFYITSTNSSTSKWMPWETGLMDGLKNRVAICPFSPNSNTNNFFGQEYLGIYPYVTIDKSTTSTNDLLWIRIDEDTYISFDEWLMGNNPCKHYD